MKKTWMVLIGILLIASVVWAYNTLNHREQGGERWVIGGSLDVVSGGEMDIESGGDFKIDGVAVGNWVWGSIEVDMGQVSGISVESGATATQTILVSPAEDIGTATKFWGEVSTDQVKVLLDQDPGTTVTMNYMVIGE